MASGGVRYDFSKDDNLTPGEARTLRFVVKDSDGADVSSFASWEFEFFVIDTLDEADGLTALRAAASVNVVNGSITASAPNADVPMTAADWPAAGPYSYELWRVDSGNENRLAYGSFPIIH